jgi:hypothetical protein
MFSTIAIAVVLAAIAVTPSTAASKRVAPRTAAFDGLWSVSIFTRNGDCPASYRYPARIVGGQVEQAQPDFSYQIGGMVAAGGRIAVRVSSGGKSATGYGRMTNSRGSGWWRADSGQCSGVWSASRRASE